MSYAGRASYPNVLTSLFPYERASKIYDPTFIKNTLPLLIEHQHISVVDWRYVPHNVMHRYVSGLFNGEYEIFLDVQEPSNLREKIFTLSDVTTMFGMPEHILHQLMINNIFYTGKWLVPENVTAPLTLNIYTLSRLIHEIMSKGVTDKEKTIHWSCALSLFKYYDNILIWLFDAVMRGYIRAFVPPNEKIGNLRVSIEDIKRFFSWSGHFQDLPKSRQS